MAVESSVNEFFFVTNYYLSIITIVIIIMNGLVIISILSQKSTRSSFHNRYLLSLAVADLCIGTFVTGPSMAKIHNRNVWPGGPHSCKTWIIADVLFSTASIYSVLFIGLDRLVAVYRPVKYSTKVNLTLVNSIIGFGWIMGLAVSVPMLFETENFSNWSKLLKAQDNGTIQCVSPLDVKSRGYVIYKLILEFLLPCILLIITQCFIIVKLRKRQKRRLLSTKRRVNVALKAVQATNRMKLANKHRDHSTTNDSCLECSSTSDIFVDGSLNPELSLTDDSLFEPSVTDDSLLDPSLTANSFLEPSLIKDSLTKPTLTGDNPNLYKTSLTARMFPETPVATDRERTYSNVSSISKVSTVTVISKDCVMFSTLDQNDINELKNKDEDGVLDKIDNCDENNLSNLTRAERNLRKEETNQRRVTMMMRAVVVAFFICYMPFVCMTLVSSFTAVCTTWMENHAQVVDLIFWMGYFNSCINPLIYTYMNKNIRTGIINIFITLKNYVNILPKTTNSNIFPASVTNILISIKKLNCPAKTRNTCMPLTCVRDLHCKSRSRNIFIAVKNFVYLTLSTNIFTYLKDLDCKALTINTWNSVKNFSCFTNITNRWVAVKNLYSPYDEN